MQALNLNQFFDRFDGGIDEVLGTAAEIKEARCGVEVDAEIVIESGVDFFKGDGT